MKRIETKRLEAVDRQTRYEALSLDQKIALAKSRRGNSKREIERLLEQKAKQGGPDHGT